MNKRDILLLCCPTDNEKKLVSLLMNYNKEHGNKLTAEILAFKNSILLSKTDLNNDKLNQLLLKNYVLYLFSQEYKEKNVFNNSILNNDLNTALKLLNNDMSVRYSLAYVYVKTINKGTIARGLKINKEDYTKVCSLLEEINFMATNNNKNTTRKLKFRTKVSSR